jgi:hypothetical protein
MSVRAYRVNKIDAEQDDTFNLWHDDDAKLKEFLFADDVWEALNDDGCGLIELPVWKLKEAVKKHKALKITDYTLKNLKNDIKWAEKKDEEYIQYYCY